MQYCKKCNVKVLTKTSSCPLCKTMFDDKNTQDSEECISSYPEFSLPEKSSRMRTRILFFIVFSSIAACTAINLFMNINYLWCIAVDCAILYAWFLIEFTFFSKANLGVKLVLHSILIPSLLTIINSTLVDSTSLIVPPTWALAYALPFILVGFTLTITITIAVTKMKWRDYTLYLFSMIILGFVPLILALTLKLDPPWPSYVSAGYSFLTLLAMFVFMDKRTKNEIRKRFHI